MIISRLSGDHIASLLHFVFADVEMYLVLFEIKEHVRLPCEKYLEFFFLLWTMVFINSTDLHLVVYKILGSCVPVIGTLRSPNGCRDVQIVGICVPTNCSLYVMSKTAVVQFLY